MAVFATLIAIIWDVTILIYNPLSKNGYSDWDFLTNFYPEIRNVWLAELAAMFGEIFIFSIWVIRPSQKLKSVYDNGSN